MIQFLFSRQGAAIRSAAGGLATLVGDRRGNIAALFALLLIPLVGVLSLAFETSSWFLIRQAMQSTADAAVLAAASNGDEANASPTYVFEAKSVAANSGFTNGVNHTTVTAGYLTSGCPAGLTNCYQVTIKHDVPLYLVGLLGYNGTSGEGGLQEIQATAYASPSISGSNTCVLVLDPNAGDVALTQNNGTMSFNGCSLQINSTNPTKGLDQTNGAITGKSVLVVGSNATYKSVTPTPKFSQAPVADPYSTTGIWTTATSYINSNKTCPPANKNITVNSGTTPISAGTYCGNLTVNSGGTLSFGSGVYVFEGVNFTTSGTVTGSGVTIILTCATPPCSSASSGWATITQNNGATSNISLSAPTSGTWSGLLFYQDHTETASSNFGFKITGGTNTLEGTVYFPTQSVQYTSGASTAQCTHFIAWQINLAQGNVNSNCAGLGVGNIGTGDSRQALVQ